MINIDEIVTLSLSEDGLPSIYAFETDEDDISAILRANYFRDVVRYPIPQLNSYFKSGDKIIVRDKLGDVYDLILSVQNTGPNTIVTAGSNNMILLQTAIKDYATPKTVIDRAPRGCLVKCNAVMQGQDGTGTVGLTVIKNGITLLFGNYVSATTGLAILNTVTATPSNFIFDGNTDISFVTSGSGSSFTTAYMKFNSYFIVPRQ